MKLRIFLFIVKKDASTFVPHTYVSIHMLPVSKEAYVGKKSQPPGLAVCIFVHIDCTYIHFGPLKYFF